MDWWSPVEGAPTIEDEAVIAYNATVVGDVQVGYRAYVVAGAVVTRDVPPEHAVTASTSTSRYATGRQAPSSPTRPLALTQRTHDVPRQWVFRRGGGMIGLLRSDPESCL
jgi:serine acetyltransferase